MAKKQNVTFSDIAKYTNFSKILSHWKTSRSFPMH